jgi:hypothetical protein
MTLAIKSSRICAISMKAHVITLDWIAQRSTLPTKLEEGVANHPARQVAYLRKIAVPIFGCINTTISSPNRKGFNSSTYNAPASSHFIASRIRARAFVFSLLPYQREWNFDPFLEDDFS